jgi:asparagine synthase (glutamine-hydrolysing)
MPGIVGIITRMPRSEAEPRLQRMVRSMLHEPFYTSGTWIDEEIGVYAGWVARQGSFSDGMPVCSESGNEVLVFSGEEYCEPGTALGLREAGHAVDLDGPSYLVHLAEDSIDFPRALNGRFHGLLVRRSLGKALLFNDRYGIHRLYIHEAPDAFYFAGEAKAILAVCPHLRQIDPEGLGDLISCGCTLENRTVYKDISLLPPASSWTFLNGAPVQKQKYFQPSEWEEQPPLNHDEYQRELGEVFPRILPRYFGGREKIGMSLTGGLDSRMILAWHRPEPHSLPFYSFGSMYRDSQDVIVARRVARACGQDYEVIPAGEEFLSRFPHYAERTVFLTDGSLEVKRSPDLYANERARWIAPVRMTGNYGSEVLRGATMFKPLAMMPGLFHRDVGELIARGRAAYGEIRKGNHLSFSVFRQMPWWLYCGLGLEQTQLFLRTPYLDNELVRLVFRAPGSSRSEAACLRLIAEGSPALARIRTDRGAGGGLPRPMAALQQAYLNFTFKAEYAYDYGMPETVARVDHALARLHLERLFLGRHKFYHFRVWYRDALAGYVREMLLDDRALSRPYVERGGLRRMVEDHTRGIRNYTTEIHRVLTLEHLHRLFIDAR